MNDFEILITNDRKWKRLALLLKSENDDKNKNIIKSISENNIKSISENNIKPIPNYNTFNYNPSLLFMNDIDWNLERDHYYVKDNDQFDLHVEEDLEDIKKEIIEVKNKITGGCSTVYKVFMDNL